MEFARGGAPIPFPTTPVSSFIANRSRSIHQLVQRFAQRCAGCLWGTHKEEKACPREFTPAGTTGMRKKWLRKMCAHQHSPERERGVQTCPI